MQIKKLTLNNFRNYEEEEFTFTDGINVLFGKNAQGKTNCAEAVFYLCTGSSLRIKYDRQLIRAGADFARISAVTENLAHKIRYTVEDKTELKISKISVFIDGMLE